MNDQRRNDVDPSQVDQDLANCRQLQQTVLDTTANDQQAKDALNQATAAQQQTATAVNEARAALGAGYNQLLADLAAEFGQGTSRMVPARR